MCDNAGFRERYAIMNGEREIKTINSHKYYGFSEYMLKNKDKVYELIEITMKKDEIYD